ncbi:hypothetical protein M9X92_011217 [Pyricularia oryzae]|uniref:AB hydrolase-1 domain-containing protein n=1 Tax=Pyricularia oryzae (strain P131) TaxID=1143193 RepID=L7IUN8_PYRO1|nr:hypothetical protein M9X92_011217 [Pyricularia oryzae]
MHLPRLLLAAAATTMASPTAVPPAPRPAVVLTPGAWHGPWAFDLVRPELSALGLSSSAVTLPTVGATDPQVGVVEDAAAARAEVLSQLDAPGERDVVLVGHSYGGIVISNAVEGLSLADRRAAGKKNGVIGVLYLTAFAIPPGTSLRDGTGATLPEWWNVTGGFFSPINPAHIFYNDVTDPALVASSVAQLKPMPFRMVTDKTGFAPWDSGFNVGYIHAALDNAIAPEVQNAMASAFPADSYVATLNASHSPFLSQPKNTADKINEAVLHFVSKKTA